MTIESEHNQKDPETSEFEKLEFLPEQPESLDPAGTQITEQLDFTPEEPPISFSPSAQAAAETEQTEIEIFGQPTIDLDLEAETPFELFGTSLFSDLDAVDDESLEFDLDEPDDDLEF